MDRSSNPVQLPFEPAAAGSHPLRRYVLWLLPETSLTTPFTERVSPTWRPVGRAVQSYFTPDEGSTRS